MRDDDSYTDWQVHYETCPRCRRDWTCEAGKQAKRRDEKPQQSPQQALP